MIAILQALDLVTAELLQSSDRAWGLSGNAVRLATLAAGVVALAAFSTRTRISWLAVAAIGAFVIQLTGTRSALLAVAVIALVGAARAGWGSGALLLTVVALGTFTGSWVADLGDLSTATDRLAIATGGSGATGTALVSSGPSTNVRLEVWGYARHAIVRKPLLGHGPGRFQAATLGDRTLRITQLEGGNVYMDAHNIVVEHLVTVGLVGASALLIWLVLAFRRARGPLAWFAAVLLIMGLLQPMDPATTGLLFLALGLAGPAVERSTLPLSSLVLGALAALTAAALVVGDTQLKRGMVDLDVGAARQANVLLRPWPEPADVLGGIHTIRWRDGAAPVDTALKWRREALRRDPARSDLLRLLADVERRAGRRLAAEHHYREALERDPWSRHALRSLASMAFERCDHGAARRYAVRSLRLGPDEELEKILTRSRTPERSTTCSASSAPKPGRGD